MTTRFLRFACVFSDARADPRSVRPELLGGGHTITLKAGGTYSDPERALEKLLADAAPFGGRDEAYRGVVTGKASTAADPPTPVSLETGNPVRSAENR